jgi:methylated-DNA-protein-cysteine methyltransferase-like protein
MSWDAVYTLVKKIPRGRVATYGRIGKALRLPGGARTAGHAMAACPRGQGIPWHRVVGAGGRLLLRESRVSLQRKLLESEGLEVVGKRIEDFATRQWLPSATDRQVELKRKEIANKQRRDSCSMNRVCYR